jgi:hypothetical protein
MMSTMPGMLADVSKAQSFAAATNDGTASGDAAAAIVEEAFKGTMDGASLPSRCSVVHFA